MSLQIELQPGTADGPFYPGSKVVGIVKLTTKTDESIAAVRISFRGRCKVKLRSSEHYTTRSYRSSAVYFREERALYEGGRFTHRAGTYVWPFAFVLPTYARAQIGVGGRERRPKRELDRMGMMKLDDGKGDGEGEGEVYDFFTARAPWRGSKDLRPHPLVGSFEIVQSRWPLDWEGRVEYVLSARLERVAGGWMSRGKDLEERRVVRVRAQGDPAAVAELALRQSVELSGTATIAKGERSSLVGKTQALLRPASVPKWTFKVEVTTGVNVVQGGQLPLLLRLAKGGADSDGAETRQPLRLQSFVISLLTTTAVRDNALTALEQTAEKNEMVELERRKGLDIELPLLTSEAFNLGEAFELRLPGDLVPSFSTYNIYRGYRLSVEVKIDCAGQVVAIGDSSMKISVLPAPAEGGPAPEYEQGQRRADHARADLGKGRAEDEGGGDEQLQGDNEERGDKAEYRPVTPPPELDQLPPYQP